MGDDEVVAELLLEGVGDWVMLHDVIWSSTLGDLNDETKNRTLRVLAKLYDDGLMVPGDLGESGFEDWPGSPEEWITRSRGELERFGWKPMGGGFWLRLTKYGEDAAQSLKDSSA